MLIVRATLRNARSRPVEVKTITFPGGELQVTAEINELRQISSVNIVAHLTSAHDIMELLLATDALRRHAGNAPIYLFMPYVPYARQDRVANPGEALSIKVFCDLINAQRYEQVIITDPHSDVTPALLERCVTQQPIVYVMRAVQDIRDPLLVCPDAGARKRTNAFAKALSMKPALYADKVRDTMTGNITGTAIDLSGIDKEASLLVIDDICDGGRTFIELAKAIREQGHHGELFLYVTHGIFSKGVEVLLEHYERIYTTRDWTKSKHSRVIEMI